MISPMTVVIPVVELTHHSPNKLFLVPSTLATNSITAEDASGNTNAYTEQEYIRDVSGNLTTDASGNYIIETNYFENVTVQRYRIVSIFSQYKDKDARLAGREPLKSYKVRLSIELSDFSKMFELLYNTKTDNNVFPFDDLTDDL